MFSPYLCIFKGLDLDNNFPTGTKRQINLETITLCVRWVVSHDVLHMYGKRERNGILQSLQSFVVAATVDSPYNEPPI